MLRSFNHQLEFLLSLMLSRVKENEKNIFVQQELYEKQFLIATQRENWQILLNF